MFLFGLFFLIRLQPVFMVSVLIVITFIYCYIIYEFIGTFWFRYVLLMVILRGVIVVFTYIITLIPNESFEIYSLVIFFFIIVIFVVGLLEVYENDFRIVSVNLWNRCFRMMILFLVRFLLGVILLVVSLRYMSDGAFRINYLSAWVKG